MTNRMPPPLWIHWTRSSLMALALATLLAAPAAATSQVADIDPTKSDVSVFGPLSGRIQLVLDEGPLAGPNRTFDIVGLNARSGDLRITLDPDLANPGLGVLRADGQFLIPALFLRIGDGIDIFDLTVLDVLGSYADSSNCGGTLCLETAFQIDTLGPGGVLDVNVVARVAEPALLVMALSILGVLLLTPFAPQRRRQGAIR